MAPKMADKTNIMQFFNVSTEGSSWQYKIQTLLLSVTTDIKL